MKIMIFICGEGLGHTSRCLALGKELLAAGHEIEFGAYGYSRDLVEKTGYWIHEIPSEIKLVGKAGGFDLSGSIEATLKNARILGGPKVLKLIKDFKPDVVVSTAITWELLQLCFLISLCILLLTSQIWRTFSKTGAFL